MAFVKRDPGESRTISFRLPPKLSVQYAEAVEQCKQAGGRLDLTAALIAAAESEIKTTLKQLRGVAPAAGAASSSSTTPGQPEDSGSADATANSSPT